MAGRVLTLQWDGAIAQAAVVQLGAIAIRERVTLEVQRAQKGGGEGRIEEGAGAHKSDLITLEVEAAEGGGDRECGGEECGGVVRQPVPTQPQVDQRNAV